MSCFQYKAPQDIRRERTRATEKAIATGSQRRKPYSTGRDTRFLGKRTNNPFWIKLYNTLRPTPIARASEDADPLSSALILFSGNCDGPQMVSEIILPGQPIPLPPKAPAPQLGRGTYLRDTQIRASLLGIPCFQGTVRQVIKIEASLLISRIFLYWMCRH